MNTVMITGTARNIDNKVDYNVNIWGSKEGEQLQFITSKNITTDGYDTLWMFAKNKASSYFADVQMLDGAYTQFIDHLIII